MKILYIASHRRAAEDAASALRGVAQDIGVVWAASLGGARLWIDKNRHVGTVLLEVETDDPGSESFIHQIRGLGVAAPVIVVSLKDPAPPLLALKAVADQVVTKDRTFLANLPHVVTRLINTTRPTTRRRLFAEAVAAADKLSRPSTEATTDPSRVEAERDALTRLNDTLAAIAQSRSGPASASAAPAPVAMSQEAMEPAPSQPDPTPAAPPAGPTREQIAREQLERRLAEASAALRQAGERATAERQASRQAAEDRQTELETALAHEASRREAAEQALAGTTTALEQAEARLAAAVRAADVRFAEQQSQHDARLTEATAALEQVRTQHAGELGEANARLLAHQRDAEARAAETAAALQRLQDGLAEADAARQRAEQQLDADRHAARRAADRLTSFESELAHEVKARDALAEALAEAERARQLADVEHASVVASLTSRHEDEQRQADVRLTSAAETIAALEARVADATAALQRVEELAAADRLAVVEATNRTATFDARLAEGAAQRDALASELAETQAALRQSDERHAVELAEASARLTDLQGRADARAAQAAAALDGLRAKLAEGAAALQRAEQQAAAERQALADEAAQRRAKTHGELMQEVARREMLEKQLAAAETRHARAAEWHTSELAAAAARLAEAQQQADARLAEATAAAATLEATLQERTATLARAEADVAREREAAATALADRQAGFDEALAREIASRQNLEAALDQERAAREQATSRHAAALAAADAQLAESHHRAEAALAQAAGSAAAALAEAGAQHVAERDAAIEAAVRQRDAAIDTAVRQRTEVEARLRQELARRQIAEGEVADARAASEQAERRFLEQAAEMRQRAREHEALLEERATRARADWEAALAERDARIQRLDVACDLARESLVASEEQTARLSAQHQDQLAAAERVRLAVEADLVRERAERAALQTTLDTAHASGAHLTHQLASLTETLNALRREKDTLEAQAQRVPQLAAQIEEIRREQRRHFEDSPLGLCRCRPDGSIIEVNRPLARMLGYDTPAELRGVDFAAAVFESGAELPWIVDRRLRSGSTESVDTTWRKKDRTKIIVRLRVVETSGDEIDLAAEDITPVRSLEERLRNAQRMESVARYASEVAATCDTLLRDVRQEAQEWLTTLSSGGPRYHGELILDEIDKATALLRQLSIYGQQQKNTADLVNVMTVLRDLEPVLKRVAGGDIELVLPQTSMPLHVDIEAERVERILVNVAAYVRGRMASSGRLIFDVASVVMDKAFFEKYPNVRPGAHVLLTVTEVRGTTPAGFAPVAPAAADHTPASDRTGVDLGTLQSLVTDCGGHLWLTKDPQGEMVLKIHLPRRALDALDPPAAPKPGRTRWIERLAGVRR